jgi:hypothetical protein
VPHRCCRALRAGAARFTYGALRDILGGRAYDCRVAYLALEAAGSTAGTLQVRAAAAAACPAACRHGCVRCQASRPICIPTAGFLQEAELEAGASAAAPPLPLLAAMGGGAPAAVPRDASALPPGWQLLELPQVQLFGIVNLPWIAPTYHFNPSGALHQGHFNMIYTKRQLSRAEGLNLLLVGRRGDCTAINSA